MLSRVDHSHSPPFVFSDVCLGCLKQDDRILYRCSASRLLLDMLNLGFVCLSPARAKVLAQLLHS